ncbi:MAG: GAF and ANTAR domain-containing protein [Jiangellaceae bacterium]
MTWGLVRDGVPRSVALATETARELDLLQYEYGDGPCLQATVGREVTTADLVDDERWGFYRIQMLAHGIQSVLSIPLDVDEQMVGALNMYSQDEAAFDGHTRVLARLVAGHCSIVVTGAVRHRDQVVLNEQLRTALTSRATIDQAVGVVMAHRGCPPDQAFDVLRTASQNGNVKLRVIAQEVVDRAAQGDGLVPPRHSAKH